MGRIDQRGHPVPALWQRAYVVLILHGWIVNSSAVTCISSKPQNSVVPEHAGRLVVGVHRTSSAILPTSRSERYTTAFARRGVQGCVTLFLCALWAQREGVAMQ